MKPNVTNWVICAIMALSLFSACSKQEQEPSQPTEQQRGVEVVSLTDLYKLVRTETAESLQEVVKEEELRSLNGLASSQPSYPITITHSYEDELRSNYTSTYKQEYERIMGSLSYEADLPKLEEIISLALSDEEKARLVTALALTTEVHAAIGANIFELKTDSLLIESGSARDEERHRWVLITDWYRNEVRDCVKVASRQYQDAVTSANNAYWRAFEDAQHSWVSTGSNLLGGVGALFGGVIGIERGHHWGTVAEKESFAKSTAQISREFNECVSAAEDRARARFRAVCTGRVVLKEPIETWARVSDTIPKGTENKGKIQGQAVTNNPSDNKTTADSTRVISKVSGYTGPPQGVATNGPSQNRKTSDTVRVVGTFVPSPNEPIK